MTLLDLRSKAGRKNKKRVGRGNGSGHGTFSGRGCKGQKARSGGVRRPGFEGGQTPFLRRTPKFKGFKNPNYIEYQTVNIGDLNVFEDNAKVDTLSLFEKKLIGKKSRPVKLLGGKGELTKTLEITLHKASKTAIAQVEARKGKITLLSAPKAEKAEKVEAEAK